MQIATAVQRGPFVHVYDTKDQQIATIPAGSGPRDGLLGFTSSTVTVRHGDFIHVYDASGVHISSTSAR